MTELLKEKQLQLKVFKKNYLYMYNTKFLESIERSELDKLYASENALRLNFQGLKVGIKIDEAK